MADRPTGRAQQGRSIFAEQFNRASKRAPNNQVTTTPSTQRPSDSSWESERQHKGEPSSSHPLNADNYVICRTWIPQGDAASDG
ncbi:hypothetical protein M514_07473 [Trichuris suis]|uniref:Uncharacterized protein n=1 Tax=Trichuris suis TaxID=68888 RepID=A0A085M2Z8_9BILA|nr:hypothetical protein M513_07473 [Trichuris suis]KFD67731.1 hypothetical protein M514_07473 [Trichuris suis]